MTSPTVFLALRISVSHGPVVYTQNVSTNFSYQGRILYLDFVFVSHREKRKWRLVRLWFSARTNQTVVTFPRSTGSFFFLFSFLAFFLLVPLYTYTLNIFVLPVVGRYVLSSHALIEISLVENKRIRPCCCVCRSFNSHG